jgi:hypothetical protein
MSPGNAAAIFRLTGLAGIAVFVSTLLLAGCSHAVKKTAPPAISNTQAITGIPACDTYLSSYLACHRAAGIYQADTLQTHYQAMRDTLLQEAGDPRVRPYLANRCIGLNQQLHDALQGQTCTSNTKGSTVPSH